MNSTRCDPSSVSSELHIRFRDDDESVFAGNVIPSVYHLLCVFLRVFTSSLHALHLSLSHSILHHLLTPPSSLPTPSTPSLPHSPTHTHTHSSLTVREDSQGIRSKIPTDISMGHDVSSRHPWGRGMWTGEESSALGTCDQWWGGGERYVEEHLLWFRWG